uniref:Putative secreted mucin n=1 Tax=Anopheles marajoara TaxID=58244 RepID=A0A2M4B9U5_9DIPT
MASGDCKMVGEGSLAMLKGKPWHAFLESSGNRSIFDVEEEDSAEAILVGGEHGQRSAQGCAVTGQQSHHSQKQQPFPGSTVLAGSATDRGTIQSRPRGSVMRLDRADMGLYGICPETDPFYAVICDICKSVVKPQGLQKHMSNRHHSHYHHAAKLNANGNTSSSTAASGALNTGSTVTAGNGNATATSTGSGNRSIANDQQLLTGTVYVPSGEKTDYRSSSAAETVSRTDASKLSSSSSSSLSSSTSSSFSGPTAGTSSSGRSGHQGESDAGGANLEPGSLAVPQPAKVRSSGSGKTKSKNAKSTHSSKSSSGTSGYGSSGTLSSSFAKASIVADGGSTMNIPLADFGGAIGSGGVPVVLMNNCSVVPDKKATFPIASDGSTGASTKSLSTKRASKQTSSSSSSSSPSSSSSSSSSYSSSNSSNSTSSSSHSSSSSSSNSFSSNNAAAQHKFSSEKKSERSRDFDPDRHCGVAMPDGKRHCTKPLSSCKSHSLSQRRAVSGRSKHLDKLIAELRTPGVSKELENTSGLSGVFLEVIESSSNSSTSFDAADRRMAATGTSSGGTGGGSGETVVRSKTPSTVSGTDSSAHGGRTSTDGIVKLLHAPGHRSGSPASHKTSTSSDGKSERSKHKQSSRSSHGGIDRGGSTTGTTGQSHSTNKSSSHHRSGSSSTKHGGPTRDSSSSSAAVTTAATITPQQPPPIVVTSQASQPAMLQSTGQQHQQLLQQPTAMPQQQSLLLANAPTEMLAQHYTLGDSSNAVLTDHTTIMMDPGSNLLKLAVSPGSLQSTVETGDGSHQQYTASSTANVSMMQDQLTVTLPLSVINSMNLSGTSLVNMAHGCGDGSLAQNASSGALPNSGPTGATLLTTGVETVEQQHTAEAFIPAELIEQLPLVAANGTDPNTAYRLAATGNAGTGIGGTTITTGGVTVDDGGLAELAALPNFNEQINYTLQTVLAQNLQNAEGTAELVDSIDDIVPTISLLPSAANPLVIPQLQGELGDSIILTPTQLTTLSQSLVDQHFIDNMTLKSAEMEIGLTVNGPVDIPSKLMLLRKVDEEFVRERQQQQQSALPYQARAGQMLDDMRGVRMWYSALPKPLHVNTFQLRRLAGGFVMNRKLLALRKNLLTEASLLGAGVTGTGTTGGNQQQNSPGATVVGRSASGSGDILLSSLSSIGKSKLGGMGEGSPGIIGAGGGTNGTVAGINVGSPMMGSPTGSGGGIGIRSGNTAPVNRGQRRMLIAQPRSGPFAGERSEKPSCLLSNTYFRNLITSMQQQQQPTASNAKDGMTLAADTNSIDRLHSLKRGASSLTTLSNKRLKIINNLHNSTAPPQMLLQGSSCKMKPKVL